MSPQARDLPWGAKSMGSMMRCRRLTGVFAFSREIAGPGSDVRTAPNRDEMLIGTTLTAGRDVFLHNDEQPSGHVGARPAGLFVITAPPEPAPVLLPIPYRPTSVSR